MANGKVIGIIHTGTVKIIGLDGAQRLAVVGEYIYEGETIVGDDINSLLEVK